MGCSSIFGCKGQKCDVELLKADFSSALATVVLHKNQALPQPVTSEGGSNVCAWCVLCLFLCLFFIFLVISVFSLSVFGTYLQITDLLQTMNQVSVCPLQGEFFRLLCCAT